MMDNEQLPKGYKNTEVGIIPEDWDVHSLFDEIDTLVAGVSVNSVNEKIDIIHDIAILKTSCVSKGSFYPSEAKKIITSDINRAKHNPKKDHIIISRMNTPDLVGECGYVEADFPNLYLPDRLWMMEFKKASNINSRWLNYILNTYVFRQKIRELGSGTSGSMKNISKSKLLELLIPYPDGAEQTAIATALSDADALINCIEKLIAKKRNIKQGAMQQLLKPKEGWEVKKLGEICDIKKGEQLNRSTLNENDHYPVFNGGVLPSGYTGEWNQNENTIIISEGGNSCGFVNFIKTKFWQGGHCYSLNTKLDKEYFYQMLKAREKEIMALRVGSGLPNIQRNRLFDFLIIMPGEEEQNEIATILSDMDAEIQALETKLEKYRKIKLGMMHNLLTGKIRLI
jgi:type I restriction enzyme S subunit